MEAECGTETRSRGWKSILKHEALEYFFHFAFLAMILVAFSWYRRLILANYHIQYHNYWIPLIDAAILAKVIMLGDALRLGERFRGRPLAVITIYQTLVFGLLVVLFSLGEHIAEAMFRGKTARDGIDEIIDQGIDEILARCVVIIAAFIPFFAMKQLEKRFGAERVRRMFFQSSDFDPEVNTHTSLQPSKTTSK